jgi:SulP family sulfate permease
MGGCAMLGRLINVSMGKSKTFRNCCSHCFIAFVMFGAGLIEILPMAALTGLMIMVAIGTLNGLV